MSNDAAAWPHADMDAVQRLRALAAGIPGAAVEEAVVDAPLDRVWTIIADLEEGFGLIEPDMRRVTVLSREADRVVALARSKYGMRARLEGVVRPGWCWLQSRFLLIGIAATDAGPGRTRVAMTGGVRVPGRAALVPIGVKAAARGALRRLAEHASRP